LMASAGTWAWERILPAHTIAKTHPISLRLISLSTIFPASFGFTKYNEQARCHLDQAINQGKLLN
jgi:hypothetical protein